MAVAVAHAGYTLAHAEISARGIEQQQQKPQEKQPAALDVVPEARATSVVVDDASSPSSSGNEALSGSSVASSLLRRDHHRHADVAWHRFGSSESALSTAISSACSSVGAEELSTTKDTRPLEGAAEVVDTTGAELTPSRKRRSDGSLKLFARRPPTQGHIGVNHSSRDSGETTTSIEVLAPSALPKKRGRPPKNVALDAENSTQMSRNIRKPPKSATVAQVRPRSSMPTKLPADVFASQCINAAYGSRLDPYSLHAGEHALLANLLMSKEVTVYLNIRNAILRLWKQNPLCCVTPDEAAGCAKEARFFGLAYTAHRWLVRNGYINFGCVEVPATPPTLKLKDSRQRTVVVVGAGVSGLTTARQLENLFAQGAEKWAAAGEKTPRVLLLEGRKRIGGRIYSKPLRSQVLGSLPDGLRNTAEMGAMIVTGFEHGNPLDTVIRAQLGLRYHLMTDALTIYDCNGKPVNHERDMLNTELYTDISDRAGEFRAVANKHDTLKGDADLINRARDPAPDGFTAFRLDSIPAANLYSHQPAARRGRRRNAPPGTEKLTGRSQVVEDSGAKQSAWKAAKDMGWKIKDGVPRNQSLALHHIADANAFPTLGSVMDEAIVQYQDIINLTAQDMRLLNWHHANLEYANAAPVSCLSLSGHDQDTGNEFEGAHSEIVGGYTQLPRGLTTLPTKLDVRFDCVVDSIHYDGGGEDDVDEGDEERKPILTKVVCTDGEVVEADQVVVTVPLGVLKFGTIDFDPPLPHWKRDAIDRMGFGLLNKVILLYEKPFWDEDRDMFGLLNEAEGAASLDPVDYERNRGRFYLIWNASKISGRPMLIALMAGYAAHDAEATDTTTLLDEVTERLRGVFGQTQVPSPLEVVVTRWKRDPFTRGTYSYVGPETRAGDYDLMAKRVGNVHFAGEATCGTHPATVHGAFLSGLRAASDVVTAMTGPIELPTPLVEPIPVPDEPSAQMAHPQRTLTQRSNSTSSHHRSAVHLNSSSSRFRGPATTSSSPVPTAPGLPRKSVCASDPSFWASPILTPKPDSASPSSTLPTLESYISTRLGPRPLKPARTGVNPFLLFTKEKWDACKAFCANSQSPAGVGRDAIRQTIGRWWKAADAAAREPYVLKSRAAQNDADERAKKWERDVLHWDVECQRVTLEWEESVRNAKEKRDQVDDTVVDGAAAVPEAS